MMFNMNELSREEDDIVLYLESNFAFGVPHDFMYYYHRMDTRYPD